MRSSVSFKFVTEFVGADADEGILGIKGADWFVRRLQQIPEITVVPNLIQDDWGVAILVTRKRRQFWFGLGVFGDDTWIAHLHRYPLGVLEYLLPPHKRQFDALLKEFHAVLATDPAISEIRWYEERDLRRSTRKWAAYPNNA